MATFLLEENNEANNSSTNASSLQGAGHAECP